MDSTFSSTSTDVSPANSPMSVSSLEDSPSSPSSSSSDDWSNTMIKPYYYTASKSVRWFRDDRGLWSERTNCVTSRSNPYRRNINSNSSKEKSGGGNAMEVMLEAVKRQDLTGLRQLLAGGSGRLINVLGADGDSALHRSCRLGHLELVKLFIRYGGDPELSNRDGWTPLHLSVHCGHQDVVVYLLSITRR